MKNILSIIIAFAFLATACGNAEKKENTVQDNSEQDAEQTDVLTVDTSSAMENDKTFFYDYLMKENASKDRELNIWDVQDFGDGKWVCAEWRNDGSMIEILYMEKQVSGEWKQRERDGYLPPISEGFVVYSGIKDGIRIISIAANDVYWNMEKDIQESWALDYVQLFFADGSTTDVKINAGERKLLLQEKETEITDWKLYEKNGKEIYSCTEAKKNDRVSLGELFNE